MDIPFSKLSGAGNDFIIIDNRTLSLALSSEFIKTLCARRTGIGADGLILIEPSSLYDFKMVYHNADGFIGSMCGNGGRCAVYFAYTKGINPSSNDAYCFEVNNHRYEAWITNKETVKLKMLPPSNICYNISVEGYNAYSVNTGSPHVIIYVEDISNINVAEEGKTIRHRTDLFPEGTNVNFVQILSSDTLAIRTFERGVEEETLACGTGAVAAALMSYCLKKTNSSNIQLQVKSNDILQVTFDQIMNNVFLTGPAKIVFEGQIKNSYI